MINNEIIPEISSFKDLMKKLEFDLKRYEKNNHSYELIDCIMTLNSLPEWIIKTENISKELKNLAERKITIMKGNNGFKFDETKIEKDIDQQLRFIRLFCNHTKHKTESGQIPKIISRYGATLPATLPAKLYNMIALGETEFDAEFLINNIYNFWKREIKE
jgi:hypothetical protein